MSPSDDESDTLCVTGCGNYITVARHTFGHKTCHVCGEKIAKRVKHTIVPLPKSNYIYAHTLDDVLSPYSHKGNR